MLHITTAVKKQLAKSPAQLRRLFDEAVHTLTAATPQERHQLLKPVYSNKFQAAQVRWTMRANHKYRLLVDREEDTYVVRGFVGRGDQRFYR
jgi:mRNA-degrading endonuclease RelE of RelBE toxin-antitoxin system